MSSAPEPEALEGQILSGENRELQQLAARGLVPLAPERLIPLQIRLTRVEDTEIVDLATETLSDIDPQLVVPTLAQTQDGDVLEYFVEHSEHPLVLETIIRNRHVPRSLLIRLAATLPADLQEILILRQDAIIAEPEILDTLEENPELSLVARRRLAEYREHLLPKEEAEGSAAEAAQQEESEATPEEVAEAIDVAHQEPVAGEVDEDTGLSEGQIRTLPIAVRLQLARGSGKALRDILIRDSSAQVALAVLNHNPYSDAEIERVAKMRTVAEEVLDTIGRSKRWMRKYAIVQALVRNPRTPIPLAVSMVPRVSVRDLRILRKDRNISEAVRNRANRLFHQKIQ